MAYAVRKITLYEVYNEETDERYTLVESPEEAEVQKTNAESQEKAEG